MKIVILQSMYDALGGIYFVNNELMKMFHEEKYDIYLVSVRMSGSNDQVKYPDYISNIIVNSNANWGVIRYNYILEELKKFNIIKSIKLIIQRKKYDKSLKKDYLKTKKIINEINPDYIINSHYELLDAIPDDYLKKTIMHFHTNFSIVKNNRSYIKKFNKYKNQIYKFVWLTKSTSDEAIKYGFTNSTYIYNSVRIKSLKRSNVTKNKNLIFLGRVSPEKRLDIILNVFDDISRHYPDWTLSLYTIGNLSKDLKTIINKNKNIKNYGSTNDLAKAFLSSSINLNASDFEGFSVAILEANEYGVPTIIFNCAESIKEEVIDGKTGIIVEKNNIDMYKEKLMYLMDNLDFLEELSLNCKEYNKHFSYLQVKKDWIDLLNGGNNEAKN